MSIVPKENIKVISQSIGINNLSLDVALAPAPNVEYRLREVMQNMVVVDRISALPNDLVVPILSLIPLKEAAATSVLSTRWRHMWTFITTLDFQHGVLFQLRSYKRVRIESEIDSYLNWVNSVMKQHRGPTVKLLKVYADLNDSQYESSIQTLGRFASEKRVQNLHIVLPKNRVFPKRGGNEIKAVCGGFPHSHQLSTVDTWSDLNNLCFKTNILPCVYLDCFRELNCLKYIRALDFRSVTGLTGQVLEFFLSHSPLLERLTVVCALRLDSFRVIGPSIALKYLHIQKHIGLLSIEICDANRVSFFYGGDEINLLLSNVPQLVEVSISSCRLSFGPCVSQLKVLRLRGFVLNNEINIFPAYVNLKHLELGLKERDSFCVLQLGSFMRASPYLHKLVLKLARTISKFYEIEMEPQCDETSIKIKQAPKYSHKFLRVVEVAEYHGRISDFELVRYLIENAVELEELVIHPVRTWYSREHMNFNMGSREGIEEREKIERKRAIHQLKKLAHSDEDAQNLVVDRISALPNDLMVRTVSLIPLKEAVATSVLSTRWRHIWTFVTSLDFRHDSLFQMRSYSKVRIESELDRYLNWVNSVMKQHRGPTIKLLRVYADINDPKYESCIHTWGRFALEKRVQNFDLVLSRNRGFPKRGGNEIKTVFRAFPSSDQLLDVDRGSVVNHLCSKPDILPSLYCCFSAFSFMKYLRALDFRYVTGLTGKVLECFLSHCPLLERLTVVCALRLDSFRVIGPSVSLKFLHIQKHTSLLSIEIRDVNLVSFFYGGDEINLQLKNVPQLVEVSISSRQLSFGDCVSQLEVLRPRGFGLNNEKRIFPRYVNLKHLELGLKERDSFCVLQLASFMRASPYLHKLVLKLARTISLGYRRKMEIKQAPKFSHKFGNRMLKKYGNRNTEEERRQASMQLKKLVPSTIEFICRLVQPLPMVERPMGLLLSRNLSSRIWNS